MQWGNDVQDLEGVNMAVMNPANNKVFAAVATLMSEHYPVRGTM
jgi:hypothetical protein